MSGTSSDFAFPSRQAAPMPFSLMTLRSLKVISLLALLTAPALLIAQSETTGKEEERLEALARSQGEWNTPKSKISVGFRVLSSGGRVDFKNLGIVPAIVAPAAASDGVVTRAYNNGAVTADSLRTDEKDVDGNQISTPGARYKAYTTTTTAVLDANGNVIGSENTTVQSGDFLSYTPGLTRQWVASTAEQISQPGYVSFSVYSTTSDGGGFSHKQGPTGGVEFQLAQELGHGSRRFQWSLNTGIALNDINSKSAGTVSSTLHTYTDYYTYSSSIPGLTLSSVTNPSYGPLYDTNGNVVASNGVETSVPINAVPTKNSTTDQQGGANVTGRWQIKGAYFMVKLGPALRMAITNHLGLTASVGAAGAYAGTRYMATESFFVASIPDVEIALIDPNTGGPVISSTTSRFLTGYYADLNLEWMLNDTVGVYTGVTTQRLSSYQQKLGDRLAKVDIGSSVGIRGGVSVRF